MSQAAETNRAPATSVKASLREVEHRRSERLLITVPIRVEGMDKNGEKFTEETRTIVINRQGARIYLKRPVTAGASLLITTHGTRSARFRVVGPTQPPSGEGGEWGVECQDQNTNIWGIGFPPPSSVEGICTALLECRRCHVVKLSHLSMVEHDVLGTSGLLVKECEPCGRMTSWGYKEPSEPLAADDTAAVMADTAAGPSESPKGGPRRNHKRVALQLPLRLRSFSGTEEFIRTENVSRGGVCFITERNYEIGEVILVTCPYEKNGQNIEVRGQVVRRREMHGAGRKIYGVSYER